MLDKQDYVDMPVIRQQISLLMDSGFYSFGVITERVHFGRAP